MMADDDTGAPEVESAESETSLIEDLRSEFSGAEQEGTSDEDVSLSAEAEEPSTKVMRIAFQLRKQPKSFNRQSIGQRSTNQLLINWTLLAVSSSWIGIDRWRENSPDGRKS